MPQIRYTAVDRGFLASGHSAATAYTFDIRFTRSPRTQEAKGVFEETLGGADESYLFAIQIKHSIQTDLVFTSGSPSAVDIFEEFLSSVANREPFEIDFTGYSGSSGTFVDVSMTGNTVTDTQVSGVAKTYSFQVKLL